jgi:hypothetical protein
VDPGTAHGDLVFRLFFGHRYQCKRASVTALGICAQEKVVLAWPSFGTPSGGSDAG